MGIGERIKQARQALGYSAEQVAEFLNVSPTTIYRYENGDISKLPAKHVKPLAKLLKISPAYLMGWDDNPSGPEKIKWEEASPKSDKVKTLMQNISQLNDDEIEQLDAMFHVMFAKKFKKGT